MASLRPLVRTWWLPVLMGVGQLLVWPGLQLLTGQHLDRAQTAIVVLVTLVAAGALGWRRRDPVVVLVVVLLALATGALVTPVNAISVAGVADVIALYSVAAWRPGRVTAAAAVVTSVVQGGLLAVVTPDDFAAVAPVTTVGYLLTALLGRARQRWRRARAAAAERLARAEADRRNAARAERDRLARELHDVTAHHLTAIVVHAIAARRLAENRPELVGQALDFAAETGRRTLAALHRLVAVIEPAAADEPLARRLGALTETARDAGQVVHIELAQSLIAGTGVPAAVADTVHAVIREATTNAMRYAPGTAVTASVTGSAGGIQVTVDNEPVGPSSAPGAELLGSGRGLAGLAARVGELGGEFEAGPYPAGGWRVRATLPTVPADDGIAPAAGPVDGLVAGPVDGLAVKPPVPGREPAPPRWRRVSSDDRFLDATLAAAALVPSLVIAVYEVRGRVGVPTAVLLLLLLLLRVTPMWWRHRAPWRALSAVLAASLAYVAAQFLVPLPPEALGPLYFGVGAEAIAVYSVARYGRPAAATWIAAVAASVAWAVVSVVVGIADDDAMADAWAEAAANGIGAVWLVFWTLFFAALWFLFWYGPAWLFGFLVRRRRARTLAAEEAALATVASQVAVAALDQRVRFAAGLHAAVLEPAQRLVVAADAGRAALAAGSGSGPGLAGAAPGSAGAAPGPAGGAAGSAGAAPGSAGADVLSAVDRVTAEARSGLAAMRELLGALRPEDPAGSAPPRGTADLAELCAEYRAAGREVTLHADPPPYPLPVAADLSGYRIVDAALDTADTVPCAVTVGYAAEWLQVTVSGAPSATNGVVAARIRARVAALGGGVDFDAAGTVTVRLPAPREEVPTSRSG